MMEFKFGDKVKIKENHNYAGLSDIGFYLAFNETDNRHEIIPVYRHESENEVKENMNTRHNLPFKGNQFESLKPTIYRPRFDIYAKKELDILNEI